MKWGGHTEAYYDDQGSYRVRWTPGREVKGTAYDTPIAGYRVTTCNTLRLWKAEAVESFDFQEFNVGDYYGAVGEKVVSETVTKVLYLNDEPEAGKKLRLAQQYFFVSSSPQDMLRFHRLMGGKPETFHEKVAIQLNDVRIVLPEKADTHHYANTVTVNRLLDSGAGRDITIYLFPKMSHAKVPLADSKIAVIGSANLTPRSMRTSREAVLSVHGTEDDPFIKKLRDRLVADMAKSKPVLEPFQIRFTDRVKAFVGKYVW